MDAPSSQRTELTELQRTLYDSRNPTRRWLHTERRERISRALRESAAGGRTERALEIGPGAGPYLPLLSELYGMVTASDIERAHLDFLADDLAGLPNLELVEDDITASRLEPGFDLVLCSEVIEHVEHPAAVLSGIRALLRPGGTLILSTPQPHSTVELVGRVALLPGIIELVRAIYREPVLPTGHISLLDRGEMGAMLGAAGFSVRESAIGGLYLPVVAELGGGRALGLERRLERRLVRRGGRLAALLWTQYWVAEKDAEGKSWAAA
ncbi:MAG TPA: class I SAM-dependent methyltransferase [Solirubrobacterales bacterium]|nr:class I SAM-dependent methyltransferase [Solirubrobacterales bacterium]